MTALRQSILFALGTALLVTSLAPAAAQAKSGTAVQTRFDGRWSVVILAESAGCQGTYRYGIQIVRGQVYYLGNDAQFSGRVDSSGHVNVNVAQGDQRAVGSGRLSANAGLGVWRGGSTTTACGGRWQAERI